MDVADMPRLSPGTAKRLNAELKHLQAEWRQKGVCTVRASYLLQQPKIYVHGEGHDFRGIVYPLWQVTPEDLSLWIARQRVSYPWHSADDNYDRQDAVWIDKVHQDHAYALEAMRVAREMEMGIWPSDYVGLTKVYVEDSIVTTKSEIRTLAAYAAYVIQNTLVDEGEATMWDGESIGLLRPCKEGSPLCWYRLQQPPCPMPSV